MVKQSYSAAFNKAGRQKISWSKAVVLAAGLGIGMLSYPVLAAPASVGDTVQGLYDALISAMKNGRSLGQSGRYMQLAPVIRRSFDIATMARLAVGPSWAGLTDPQSQQVAESFGRYMSAIWPTASTAMPGKSS